MSEEEAERTDERGAPSSYDELINVLESLPVLIREKRRRDRLSLRAAGDESGAGFNTHHRTERGEHCSLANALRLLTWLDGKTQPSTEPTSLSLGETLHVAGYNPEEDDQ